MARLRAGSGTSTTSSTSTDDETSDSKKMQSASFSTADSGGSTDYEVPSGYERLRDQIREQNQQSGGSTSDGEQDTSGEITVPVDQLNDPLGPTSGDDGTADQVSSDGRSGRGGSDGGGGGRVTTGERALPTDRLNDPLGPTTGDDGAQDTQPAVTRQDLRAATVAATQGSGELARGVDATDFNVYQDEVASVQQQVESRYPSLESGEDYTVQLTEQGNYVADLTEQGQQQLAEMDAALQNAAAAATQGSGELARTTPDRLSVQQEFQRRQQAARKDLVSGNLGDPEEIVAQKLSDKYGFTVTENDVQNVGLGEGGITFELSPTVVAAIEFQQETNLRSLEGSVDLSRSESGGFNVSVTGVGGIESDLESQLDQQIREVEARQRASQKDGELVDWDWSFGLGGSGDEVEGAVDAAAGTIQNVGQTVGNEIFKPSGIGGQSAGEEVLQAAGYPELGEAYESGLRSFGKGIVTGGTAIANVPGLVGGLMEGGEAAGYATARTLEGRSGMVVDQGVKIAEEIGQEVAENPFKTGGALLGSLGASTALFRTARRVSPRLGSAARWTIQPGEEALGSVGYRLTRSASGVDTAETYFPNREPLLFSEEAAIRAGRRAIRKGRRLGRLAAGRDGGRFGGFELEPSPYQRELVERFRPGTATETLGEEGQPGALSEPLGSDTESILDATLGAPESQFQTQTEAQQADLETDAGEDTGVGITDEMQRIAGQAQGRSELARAFEEFGVNVNEFNADTRGRLDLSGPSLGRSETSREIQDDRVTANLYQQAVDRQVKADFETLEGGSGRESGQAFEARARESDIQAERPDAERLTERAQEPEVTAEIEGPSRSAEATLSLPQQGVNQQAGLFQQFRLNTRPGTAAGSDSLLEVGAETGTETDQLGELALAMELDPSGGEYTTEGRRPSREREGETELQPGEDTPPEIEVEPRKMDEQEQNQWFESSGRKQSGSSEGEMLLGSGWFSEYVTDLALGAGPTEAPSQKALEGLGGVFAGQRPTKAMLSGSEAEQEQIQAVEDFFFLGDESDGGGLL